MNVHVKGLTPAVPNNEVRLFDFKDNDVRVVKLDGNPWFVAKDAIRVLGFNSNAGASWLVRHLDESEFRHVMRSNVTLSDVSFPNRGAVCLSESGLYRLVMRSDKPDAREFQDWVTKEVLPAIRKDGGYVMGEEKVRTGEMSEDELVLRAVEVLQRKIERLREENERMEKELNFVTVDEYRSLRHEYWPHPVRSAVGMKAAQVCRERGIQIDTQTRRLGNQRSMPVRLNVYPREVLDEVAPDLLRIFGVIR